MTCGVWVWGGYKWSRVSEWVKTASSRLAKILQVAYDLDLATRTLMEIEDARAANGWQEGVPPSEKDTGIEWIETSVRLRLTLIIRSPPRWVKCYPWPELNGPSLWPWVKFKWVAPWVGFPWLRNVT